MRLPLNRIKASIAMRGSKCKIKNEKTLEDKYFKHSEQ